MVAVQDGQQGCLTLLEVIGARRKLVGAQHKAAQRRASPPTTPANFPIQGQPAKVDLADLASVFFQDYHSERPSADSIVKIETASGRCTLVVAEGNLKQAPRQESASMPEGHKRRGEQKAHCCKVTFPSYDVDRDTGFDLVPRLIGRQGANLKRINEASGGQVQIRGRGSRHQGPGKDAPLHLLLSCQSTTGLDEGKRLLHELLEGVNAHFHRYCRKMGYQSAHAFYSIDDAATAP